MFEINLCCPECGSVEWYANDNGSFECVHCGYNCDFEQMNPQAFDKD